MRKTEFLTSKASFEIWERYWDETQGIHARITQLVRDSVPLGA